MAILWVEGFEHGTASATGSGLFNNVSASGLTIQSTTKRTGTYALQANTTSAQSYVTKTISTNYVTGRFYIRWATLASATQAFITLGATNAKIYLNSSNVFCADINGSGVVNSGITAVTGQWYRVDFKFTSNANPHTLDWQIDGVTQAQSTNAVAAAASTNIYLGQYSTATANLYIDDCIFSDATADYPFGAGGVEVLLPDEDASLANPHNYLVNASGTAISGSVHAHDQLNNIPLSETTTRVAQTDIDADDNDATYVRVKFADTSQTDIHGVQVFLNYGAAGTSLCRGVCITTNEDAVENTIWGSPSSKADYSDTSPVYKSVVPTAPTGGWDQTAVNAQSVTLGMSSDATPDPYWNNICMQVAYGTVDPNVTVVTAPIAGTFSTIAPTVSATGGVTVSPALVTGQFSAWNNPSVLVSSTYVPDPIAAQLSTLAPTVSAGGAGVTVTPNQIDGQFSASGMAAQSSLQIAVDPASGTISTIDPADVGAPPVESITVYPGIIEGIFSTISNAVKATATVLAELAVGVMTILAPAVATTTSVTVSTPVVSAAFSVPNNPSITANSLYVCDTLAGTFSAIQPTAGVQSDKTVAADLISGQFSTVASSVSVTTSVTVSTEIVSRQFVAIGTAVSTTASATATPGSIVGWLSATDPTVSKTSSVTAAAGVVSGQLSTISPTVLAGGNVTIQVSVLQGVFTAIDPTIAKTASANASAPLVVGYISATPDPVLSGSARSSQGIIVGTLSTYAPTVTAGGNATVQPGPVVGVFSASGMTPVVSTQIAVDQVVGTLSAIGATVDLGVEAENITVYPAVISGLFSASGMTSVVSSQIAVDYAQMSGTAIAPTFVGAGSVVVYADLVSGVFYVPIQSDVDADAELIPYEVNGTLSALSPGAAQEGGKIVYPGVITGRFSVRNPRFASAHERALWFKVRGAWIRII